MSTAGAGPKPSDLAPHFESGHHTESSMKADEIVAKEITTMNRITRNAISLVASIALALSFAMAAPKAEAASKYFTAKGKVLKIDQKNRTLLVSDRENDKLYLVSMPEGSILKITWGRFSRMVQPGFTDVYKNDRVQIRCHRTDSEHLAQVDGQTVVTLTASSR